MGESENKVQAEIRDWMNKATYRHEHPWKNLIQDGILYRVNNKGIRGRRSTLPKGFPDLVGDVNIHFEGARPVYVECKAPEIECDDDNQLNFQRDAEIRGAISIIANSLEEFKEKLLYYIKGD